MKSKELDLISLIEQMAETESGRSISITINGPIFLIQSTQKDSSSQETTDKK